MPWGSKSPQNRWAPSSSFPGSLLMDLAPCSPGRVLVLESSPAQLQCWLLLLLLVSYHLAKICDPAGDNPEAVQATGCQQSPVLRRHCMNYLHLSPTDLLLLVHSAAVEMFVAFVTTHPLLRAGQDKGTCSGPKDRISLGNKSLVGALWHMGL